MAGAVSQYAARITGPSGAQAGFRQDFTARGAAWYVIEGDVTLVSGAFAGAGILAQSERADGTAIAGSPVLPFFTSPDETGVVIGSGVLGDRYRFTHLFRSHGDTTEIRVFAMSHWVGHTGGTASANEIDWHRVSVRPATQTEIRDFLNDGRIAQTEADITVQQTVSASLEGHAAATRAITVGANGAASQFVQRAIGSGAQTFTEFLFSADSMRHLVDGDVIWESDSEGLLMRRAIRFVGGGTNTNPNTMYVIGNGFGANSDLLEWFGPFAATTGSLTTANAVRAKDVDGKTYLNGQEEGAFTVTASDSAVGAASEVTSIGANGNMRQVPGSFVRTASRTYETATDPGNFTATAGSATVVLRNREAGGTYTNVATANVTGQIVRTVNFFDVEHDVYHVSEVFMINASLSYSFISNAALNCDNQTVLTAPTLPNFTGWQTANNFMKSVSVFEAA